MASIKCNTNTLFLALKNKAIAFSFVDGTYRSLECNPNQSVIKSTDKKPNSDTINDNSYESIFLPCCDISSCGQWFVFCVSKHLLLWSISSWSLIASCSLQRSPSKIIFSPDGSKIIVADKGGEIVEYPRDNLNSEGSYLLGHLSLLLDMLITNSCEHIITCDRDEKIRVSCYPNAYNIVNYCLNHEEFVTCIKVLPHSENILVSGSGDGTIRLWNFKLGKQLFSYTCLNDIDERKFVFNSSECNAHHIAIMKIEIFSVTKQASVMCVLFDHYKDCLIYSVKGDGNNFVCSKLQNLEFGNVLRDITISTGLLWVVFSSSLWEVTVFQWNEALQKFEFNIKNEKITDTVVKVNKCLSSADINFRDNFSILYKKQFDNVEEYYKRKQDQLNILLKKSKIQCSLKNEEK